ncbi:MAG: prolipoprotein diacylglyceryl transferase [Candidatus Woesearchaeota archaeon]
MFIHSIDPVIIELFGLEIRYYGLVYALGFLFMLYISQKLITKDPIRNLDKQKLNDLYFWCMLSAIIGARIFHILFYNPLFYFQNPLEIIALWHGGMSFHGGIVGAILAGYFFCRKHRISFLEAADIIILPFPIVLFFGRIANFINAELVGPPTDLPWCVVFPGHEGCRHPTVLYEAIKNLFLFGLLFGVHLKKKKPGTILWTFLLAYSILRFFVQFLRPETKYFLGLDSAQLLSLIFIPLAAYMLYRIRLPSTRIRGLRKT